MRRPDFDSIDSPVPEALYHGQRSVVTALAQQLVDSLEKSP